MDAGPSWTTIAMVLFVIIGCIMVVFLGYMIRSAYDLRIGLKAQLDRGLRAVEEDGAKKARQLRQELGAEIDRARAAMLEDARRKLAETSAAVERRQADFETSLRQERVQTTVALDMLRDELAELTRRIDDLERELLVGGPAEPIAPPLPPASQARPAAPEPPVVKTPPRSTSSAAGIGTSRGSAATIVAVK